MGRLTQFASSFLRSCSLLFLAALSCTGARRPRPATVAIPPHRSSAPSAEHAVALVVLDGVRWQEIFHGVDDGLALAARLAPDEVVSARELMPNLWRLADRGVAIGDLEAGPLIEASGPNYVSLPGYTELFTGRAPVDCRDNDCHPNTGETIADALATHDAFDTGVVVLSSWEKISRVASGAPDRLIMSTGRTGGLTRDALRAVPAAGAALDEAATTAPWPGSGDFRPDRLTSAIALRYVERVRPRFLFLGLGEPDEFAHAGDYRGYLQAMRAADTALGELCRALKASGAVPDIFVTADHGRSRTFRDHGGGSPESRNVWLVAAGPGIRSRGGVPGHAMHQLADVAPTIRALTGLAEAEVARGGSVMSELLEIDR